MGELGRLVGGIEVSREQRRRRVFEADLKVLEVWAEQTSIAFAKDFASIEQLLSTLKGDQ